MFLRKAEQPFPAIIYSLNFKLRTLVLCPNNKFTKMLELFEDRVGGGGPNEGATAGIVVSHVLVDAVHNSRTLRNDPRRIACWVMSANQHST
jgi:hypothetical protein